MIKVRIHISKNKPDRPIPDLKSVVKPIEQGIRQSFFEARSVAGLQQVALTIGYPEDFTSGNLNNARTVFEAVPALDQVRVTWEALASLWFACFAVVRLGALCFHARRKGQTGLIVDNDGRLGLRAMEAAQTLTKKKLVEWPTDVPSPDEDVQWTEDVLMRTLFFGAIRFILLHELAHIFLGHRVIEAVQAMRSNEFAADEQAARWLVQERVADQDRLPGDRPAQQELQLEGWALRAGVALIWIALFEQHNGQSSDHPEVATRFYKVIEVFGLREDSGASEILSDVIKAWLDPDGNWSSGIDASAATARAAMDEAISQMHSKLKR